MALKDKHTIEAKKSLEQLVEQYRKENQQRKALDLYADFMEKLEPLVKSDSTLIDQKFFQAHEARIAQLEKRTYPERRTGSKKEKHLQLCTDRLDCPDPYFSRVYRQSLVFHQTEE